MHDGGEQCAQEDERLATDAAELVRAVDATGGGESRNE